MAGVSTPALAAAVSNAGGLGSLGIGASSVSAAGKAIEELRGLTDRPFNVNVFVHRPAQSKPELEQRWLAAMAPLFENFSAKPPTHLKEIYKSFIVDDEMITLITALAPKVVSFHFGLPDNKTIMRLKAAGCILFATVTSLSEAKAAAKADIDAIIAQGYEAGGHRGVFDPSAPDEKLETAALVKRLAAEMDVPIVAAGGIMDGYAAKDMLAEGASAVQLGTAFIACPESNADDAYRRALASALEGGTVMTKVISGRPARSLHNDFTRWGDAVPAREIPDYPIAYDAGKALNAAAKAAGENGYGAQWAGAGVFRSREMPASELMQKLLSEMRE